MEKWERTIVFEGVSLPETAIAIDHLGMYGNLPEMSEETSLWLWRFSICVGTPRNDFSEVVLRHASESLELISRFRERLVQTVAVHYQGTFSEEILDSWADALRTMSEVASDRERCTWEAPLGNGNVEGRMREKGT